MRDHGTLLLSVVMVTLAGCGDGGSSATSSSGVTGVVLVGPQCPVEVVGQPCPDRGAGNVSVTASAASGDHPTGKPVAQGTTDAHGSFRIALTPGEYVVTASAGMSCKPIETRVVAGRYVSIDILCDSGIR